MVQTLTGTRSSAAQAEPLTRWARLTRDQLGFVWRLLRRIGVSEAEVDAAAEEVFAAAAQRISDLRLGSERSFLFGTALHVAARTRREHGDPSEQQVPDSAPTLEDMDPDGQSRAILDALLQQMPLELRVVFILSEIEQLAAADVADIVGISSSTVATRLGEAQEQFACHLPSESELSLSLLAAARLEQPEPATLARVLAARGIRVSSLSSLSAGAAKPAQGSSHARTASRSAWKAAAKGLLVGLLLGLLTALGAYAIADVRDRAPGGATAR